MRSMFALVLPLALLAGCASPAPPLTRRRRIPFRKALRSAPPPLTPRMEVFLIKSCL